MQLLFEVANKQLSIAGKQPLNEVAAELGYAKG